MRLRREVLDVIESPLVRIATLAESMPGAIKLCYGESDSPTPEFICRAANEAALAGHTFYTNPAGCPELREAIAGKVLELHGVAHSPAEIMCTVGASMAIYAAIRAQMGAGDNAVIISPAYAIYANGVTMCGGEAREVPLTRAGRRFCLDIDQVRRAIDSNTRMIIVNSPSNPTGWIITAEEQRELYELAERNDIVLLADEVYERLVFNGEIAASFARVAADKDHLIVVNSFSKTYHMTGWRLGWAQASERVVREMAKAVEFMTSNPAAPVQQAGIVALRDGESHVRTLREQNASRRAMVAAALSAIPGLELVEPQGAFFAFFSVKGLTNSTAFTMKLLQEAGVALAPGAAFGAGGEGHVRLCFAASSETLTLALERMRLQLSDV